MSGLDPHLKNLHAEESASRERAVQALKDADAAGQEALAGALTSQDPQARSKAAWALWRIGPDVKHAVPALLRALADEDGDVRYWAVCALGRLRAGGSALHVLIEVLKDMDEGLLRGALEALHDAGAGAVAELLEELESEDPGVRHFAAVALGPLGESASEAVPALVAALRDDDPGVSQAAARALVQIEPDAERILREVLADERPEVLLAAAGALAQLDPEDAEARDTLLALSSNDDAELREMAVRAIGAAGSGAEAVLHALSRALGDRDRKVRIAAAEALGRLGPAARAATRPLLDAMARSEWDLWEGARASLLSIGPIAAPDLIEALGSTAPKVAQWAAWGLERLGADSPEVVRSILRELGSPVCALRAPLFDVLGRIGDAAKAAVPILTDALSDGEERVREAAREALRRLGA